MQWGDYGRASKTSYAMEQGFNVMKVIRHAGVDSRNIPKTISLWTSNALGLDALDT